jgi:hypothetical protein
MRFRGKLGGRQGTFVLQGQEIVESGEIKATWFVVPGSGTGGLSRLRCEGGFEGEFGKRVRRNAGLLVRIMSDRFTAERSQAAALAIRISEFCRSQFSVAL